MKGRAVCLIEHVCLRTILGGETAQESLQDLSERSQPDGLERTEQRRQPIADQTNREQLSQGNVRALAQQQRL